MRSREVKHGADSNRCEVVANDIVKHGAGPNRCTVVANNKVKHNTDPNRCEVVCGDGARVEGECVDPLC